MKKIALALAFLFGSFASAFAVCTPPAVMHDFPGTSFNMSMVTNATDGNCATVVDTPTAGVMATALALINTSVNLSIPAGTNAIGVVSISPTAASGGWTHFSSPHDNANAPISTTVVAVKSSAVAKFGGYYISNTNATVACLQVFDVATAGGVTLGTTRPDMVYCVPATSGANLELGNGVAMANGIQIAATTTASGSSALGAGLDVTIYFK